MNKGLMLGKFVPMHKGHKYAILKAATLCEHLTVLLCIDHEHDPKFPTPTQREEILRKELGDHNNITVEVIDCTAFPYAKHDDMQVSKYWAKALHNRYPDLKVIFGSEKYVEYMTTQWPDCNGIKHSIIDLSRINFPISATQIRNEPMRYFDFIVDSAKPMYTKHVLVIGSESCGKSTLVNNLGEVLDAPTVPEMYRSLYPEKGMDFKPEDLIRVAASQNAAVRNQVASPQNKGMIIHDTCNDVTLTYLDEYFPNDDHRGGIILEKRNEVKFDLVLFCDIDVPWEQDGTRTIGGEEDRQRMRDKFYSLAVQKASKNNCPMVVLGADYKRIPDALAAIKEIM